MSKRNKIIETFNDRYPLIGPTFWMLSIQYFITQLVVALAWKAPYSMRLNTISDLGNTACGAYGGRQVCSPLHSWMNASFIVLGITMIAGAILICREFNKTVYSAIGFSLMALAGLGTVLVGAFTENAMGSLHALGAAMPFVMGNIGLILLGVVLILPKPLRLYSIISGLVGLIGLVFFITHTYLGIGVGGVERITAYPQTIWLIVFGIFMTRNHYFKKENYKS